jgi:hypothetical protein
MKRARGLGAGGTCVWTRRSLVHNAARQLRPLGGVVALCSVLVASCKGNIAANAPPDASGRADDSGGTAADGSSGGPSVDGSGVPGLATAADSGGCWPASLDATDAADGRCVAGRAYLSCMSNSATELCVSDDPTQCPGPAQPGNGTFACHNQCAPYEYAITCGQGGFGGTPEPTPPPPPASCRFLAAVEGVSFGCCPCDTPGGVSDSGSVADDAGGDGADSSASDSRAEASDDGPGLADPDAAQPMPDAFVLAYVGPGTGSTSVCGYQSDQTFVAIGAPLDPKPSTVTSGDFQQGAGTVSLSCAIDPGGGGFSVKINAEIGGPNGGALTVVGQVNAAGGTGIYGGFTSAQNGTFIDQSCSITFTYNAGPVPVGGSPVAAGRIWGHIDCPDAQENGTSEITDDGAATERTCDAHADFLFENCQ